MNIKNIKTKCTKQSFSKCIGVCKTYSPIATVYAEILNSSEEIIDFKVNILLDDFSEGDYTTDFVCRKSDGSVMVRECIERNNIQRPKNARLLDASRNYWIARGIVDWGVVTNE